MSWTSIKNGTQAGSSTETPFGGSGYSDTTVGSKHLFVDYSGMASTDVAVVRVYRNALSGGTPVLWKEETITGQGPIFAYDWWGNSLYEWYATIQMVTATTPSFNYNYESV